MTLCVELLTHQPCALGDTVVPVFSSSVWTHGTHSRTIVPSDVPETALSVTGRACRREHETSCCSCRSSTPGRLVAKRLSPSAVDRQQFHPHRLRASCARRLASEWRTTDGSDNKRVVRQKWRVYGQHVHHLVVSSDQQVECMTVAVRRRPDMLQ